MGQEEPLRQLLEAVTDYAIFLLDKEGRILTWNTGAERIKGYTQGEIIGEHCSRLYTAQDAAEGRPEQALQAAAEDGHHEEEGWRVRKDCSWFWADVVTTPLRGDGGEIVGFAKVARDLSGHRRAEDQIRLIAERERIGKALQAGTIKLLFAIGVHLQSLAALSEDEAITCGLQDCIGELDQAIHGLRAYVFGLDPAEGPVEGGTPTGDPFEHARG
jgi:PAS domain S-box-containing protein